MSLFSAVRTGFSYDTRSLFISTRMAIRCNLDIIFARLAQLGERRSAEREVTGSNPRRTNNQGPNITEKKVLPL